MSGLVLGWGSWGSASGFLERLVWFLGWASWGSSSGFLERLGWFLDGLLGDLRVGFLSVWLGSWMGFLGIWFEWDS